MQLFYFVVLTLSWSAEALRDGQFFQHSKNDTSLNTILETLSLYRDNLTLPKIWEAYNNENRRIELNSACYQSLHAALNQFPDELWPIQMLDAWGKFPEGILSGHIAMMGDFQECMLLVGSIQSRDQRTQSFKGRYCPMHLVISSNNDSNDYSEAPYLYQSNDNEEDPLYTIVEEQLLQLTQPTLAACLPSTCTRTDFIKLFSVLTLITRGRVRPITSYCQTEDKPKLDVAVIAMIGVCGILLTLAATGSTLESLYSHKFLLTPRPIYAKILTAFAVQANLIKLFKVDAAENLGCLHGLRFLSMCWVVLGHTWSVLTYGAIWNGLRIESFHKEWTMLTIVNATFCVDTFFTLSGFLLAYLLLNGLDKRKGSFNPFQMYLHRYLRLTPTYAILLGLIATIQPYVSNGPMWGLIEMNSKYCRKNWWQNLLYVNNLLTHNPRENPYDIPCFGEAWYLGCDMQFFVVFIWVVYLLWKYRRGGFVFMVLITISSILTPGAIIGWKNLMPLNIPFRAPTGEEKGNYDLDVYVKPWTRAAPYLAGMWAGYAYYITKNRLFHLNSVMRIFGWITSTLIALSVLYGPVQFFDLDRPIKQAESIVYGGLARFAWGVAISWIIYACVTGSGGIVNRFLSMNMFVPLGRITFCTYLVSFELQQIFHARYPHPISYDVYFLVNMFLAHLSMSLMFGFILTILIESPFIQLEKILLRSR